MLTLALLRHAKSSWDDMKLDDFERPLAKRGINAAPRVARYIVENQLVPDLVLCSTAVRTRATLALVLPELRGPAPSIQFEEELYLASPETILERLARVPAKTAKVLVLGHNPGLHGLALSLTGSGERDLIGKLAADFPTAALAVLELEAKSWSEIRPGRGRLAHFVTPKDLRE